MADLRSAGRDWAEIAAELGGTASGPPQAVAASRRPRGPGARPGWDEGDEDDGDDRRATTPRPRPGPPTRSGLCPRSHLGAGRAARRPRLPRRCEGTGPGPRRPAGRLARRPAPPLAGRRAGRCRGVPPRFPRRGRRPRGVLRAALQRDPDPRGAGRAPRPRRLRRERSPSSPNGSGSRWRSTRRCRPTSSPRSMADGPARAATSRRAPSCRATSCSARSVAGAWGSSTGPDRLKPNRLVALKMILEGRFASEQTSSGSKTRRRRSPRWTTPTSCRSSRSASTSGCPTSPCRS